MLPVPCRSSWSSASSSVHVRAEDLPAADWVHVPAALPQEATQAMGTGRLRLDQVAILPAVKGLRLPDHVLEEASEAVSVREGVRAGSSRCWRRVGAMPSSLPTASRRTMERA